MKMITVEDPTGKLVTLESNTVVLLDKKKLLKRNHITGGLMIASSAMTSDIQREIEQNETAIQEERSLLVREELTSEQKESASRVAHKGPEERGVYLLRSNSGLVKIGCTKNIFRRMSTYVSGVPEDLVLFAFAQTKQHKASERYLHFLYKDKRVKGEWFNLNDNDLAYLLDNFDFSYVNKPIQSFLREALPAK
jgi:hypothetical protein